MYHKKIVTMQEHSAWDQIILPKNIKPKKLNNQFTTIVFKYSSSNGQNE